MTRRRMIAVAVLALACASCAPRRLALPSAAGQPASDGADALAEATAACRDLKSITAEIGVSGSLQGRKVRGRLIAGFAQPASARIEAAAPFGAPLFIFVARGGEGTLLLPRDNRFLEKAEPATLLDAVAGVPFAPADLMAIISGCATPERQVVSATAPDPDWRRVRVAQERELFLHRVGSAWQLVAMTAEGREPVQVEYGDRAAGRPQSVRLIGPAASGTPRYDLRLSLSQVEVDAALDADAFRVQIPRGADPISLDELRRNGPLGAGADASRGH
jgi:hypothetical protein